MCVNYAIYSTVTKLLAERCAMLVVPGNPRCVALSNYNHSSCTHTGTGVRLVTALRCGNT